MENPVEKKIVQNAILIDTSEPVDLKDPKPILNANQEIAPSIMNSNNQGNIPNSQDIIRKTETEFQNKNEKKKNFFNKFTEKLKSPQSEALKNKILKY